MNTFVSMPTRTSEQRLTALHKANQIRCLRADFKRCKPTAAEVAAILLAEPWWAESMKVADLLMVVPLWGRVKARKTMLRCRVAESKKVGGLSDRQRHELAQTVIA